MNKATIQPTGTRCYDISRNRISLLGCAVVQFWVGGRLFEAEAAISKHVTEAIIGCSWLREMQAIVHFGTAQIRIADLTILLIMRKASIVRRISVATTVLLELNC